MTRADDLLSPSAILDETPPAVVRIAPWLGFFWLLNLPYRFLQMHFFRELCSLNFDALTHGDYLGSLALYVFLALLPALYGKAVFGRACFLGLQSGRRVSREALKVPPRQLLVLLYLTLLTAALFYLLLITFLAIPFLVLAGGLAVVTALRAERVGLIRPLRELCSFIPPWKLRAAFSFLYSIALIVAFANSYFAFRLGVWLAGGAVGTDLSRWDYLLRPSGIIPAEPLAAVICLAGAILIVEPFWLASLVVYAHRSKLRETGEDLRLWFQKLKRTA